MEAKARITNCPMSARKMRLVIDTVRGKQINNALDILQYTKKETAIWVEKTLLSAISNWENSAGDNVNIEDHGVYIKEIFADDGPMIKRFRPVPFGRAHRIRKRRTHLTIILGSDLEFQSDSEDELTNND